MGLPEDIKELKVPGYILKTLYVIGFFRDIVDALCTYIGLQSFLDNETSQPDPTQPILSTSVSLAEELIPVVRFSDLLTHPEHCCTICLADFESYDKVKQLPTCRHVFHDRCMDRWILDCRKMTCPICRNRFLPVENYAHMDSDSSLVWFGDELERTNKCISGENKHYDSPTNPAAPSRIPGGACSGAAVSVATNAVDFALGIDTVGGVRVPAGYCGVLGFKSSHGIILNTGIIPVSSSLDSVGWFASDPNTLRRVGHVLLQLPFATQRNSRQIILADDCFQLLKIPVDRITQVVIKSAEKLFGRQLLKHQNLENYFDTKVPSLKEFARTKAFANTKVPTSRLLANVMQLLQREEDLNKKKKRYFKLHLLFYQGTMEDSQAVKSKGPYKPWSGPETKMLLRLLIDAINQGFRDANGKFNKLTVERRILPTLNEKLGTKKTLKEYKSRMKFLKGKYLNLTDLLRFSSGFGWDPETKKFTARDEVWDDYFKAHPTKTHMRDESFEDFEDLRMIFGSNTACGKNAVGLSDTIDVDTFQVEDNEGISDRVQIIDDTEGIAYEETSVHEVFSSIERKRGEKLPLRKKARTDEVDSMTEISQFFDIMQKKWEKETEEREAEDKANNVWDAIKEIPDLDDDLRYEAMNLVHSLGMKSGFVHMSIAERNGWIKRNLRKPSE